MLCLQPYKKRHPKALVWRPVFGWRTIQLVQMNEPKETEQYASRGRRRKRILGNIDVKFGRIYHWSSIGQIGIIGLQIAADIATVLLAWHIFADIR